MQQPGRRRRILIVDDEEPMRLLLAQYVEADLGAEVALAGTCEAALRLVRDNAYDVILLDMLMPGIGGGEVLKRIRTDSANQATPVVIVSVLATSSDVRERMSAQKALALGANAVVAKPVDRYTLIGAVKAHLGGKRPLIGA
jgi:CheY-like chemotaxis protein